jgi:N utilization substance protein A
MPLDQAGIKEHVCNILVEAGIDTVGSLMMKMKLEPNRVLGLAGIGPKAIQNIEEALAALQFPEPLPAEPAVEPIAEIVSEPEAVAVEPAPAEEMPVAEKQIPAKKEARKVVEEEDERAKDGVSLDELFAMKPEIFQKAGGGEEELDDKKKGKKGKKKSVALEFDEERGEVVARKVHKRGGEVWEEE